MSDQKRQMALSRWISGELTDGITLTNDVLSYLDATFGTQDLPFIFADADSCEIDSMLELLFYPDIALQLRYEQQWGQQIFSTQDENAVITLLSRSGVVAEIVLPETGRNFSIPVPDFVLKVFVQRLNICWKPSFPLVRAVDKNCTDESWGITRVQLRNAALTWHEDHAGLVCLFLSNMSAQAKTFESDLAYLISILSELKLGADFYTFLTGKKFFCFLSLCKAEDYERKRLSSNMEILMMAGTPSVHGNIGYWRQCMHRIDRICRTLFGRTEFFQQPDNQYMNLGDGLNMQDVFNKLS